MKQHRFAAGRSVLQLCSPVANEFPHIDFGSLEFLYLLAKRTQLLLRQLEYAMAGYATVIPSPENV